jgi:hypothetical protein
MVSSASSPAASTSQADASPGAYIKDPARPVLNLKGNGDFVLACRCAQGSSRLVAFDLSSVKEALYGLHRGNGRPSFGLDRDRARVRVRKTYPPIGRQTWL